MAREAAEPVPTGPAVLTLGTVDSAIWLRKSGAVRVQLIAEDTRENVIAYLKTQIAYLQGDVK